MGKSHRYITSLLLTMIYLLIVFSPLAPLAIQSKSVAHALTGECSGDCRIDGCSLERSAAHTCCCWQKKLHGSIEPRLYSNAECGTTPPAQTTEIQKKALPSCCAAQARDSDENNAEPASVTRPPAQKERSASIGSRPCGSGKLFTLLNIETTLHLPFFFTGEFSSPAQRILTFFPPDRLTSRYVDPPDPPPIISRVS